MVRWVRSQSCSAANGYDVSNGFYEFPCIFVKWTGWVDVLLRPLYISAALVFVKRSVVSIVWSLSSWIKTHHMMMQKIVAGFALELSHHIMNHFFHVVKSGFLIFSRVKQLFFCGANIMNYYFIIQSSVAGIVFESSNISLVENLKMIMIRVVEKYMKCDHI